MRLFVIYALADQASVGPRWPRRWHNQTPHWTLLIKAVVFTRQLSERRVFPLDEADQTKACNNSELGCTRGAALW